MSGVHRFLSKRERHGEQRVGRHHGKDKLCSSRARYHDPSVLPPVSQSLDTPFLKLTPSKVADMGVKQSSPVEPARHSNTAGAVDYYGLFKGPERAANANEEQKVKNIRKRMMDRKAVHIKDVHILWALHSKFSNADPDKAFDLLLAISNASEGLVTDYNPHVKLLGAENRESVTCYLDSILFAMFSRLDSFEAMLYNSFEDAPRSRLGLLIRTWVNLLRSGKLITTDLTKLIQDSLAECGWLEAVRVCQQDASEAFSFITGKLELPLLTLKMDIYHTGREDTADDHKFINERLLEVAIPTDLPEGTPLTLEDCLEHYFNNRIEVRRYLERRTTLNSMQSFDSSIPKSSEATHVEVLELDLESSPLTPLSQSPSFMAQPRPGERHRAPSIIQDRFIPEPTDSTYSLKNVESRDATGRIRKGSIRKEVMMPAWQFFSLIPWYTNNVPSNDTQVAAHFSKKRPVLGLCLKRYSMTEKGRAVRLATQIDIPIEIGLPHFIQDDHVGNEDRLYGNFKLSLQSVVCHRGNSVHSGHYISLVKGTTGASSTSLLPEIENSNHWMRFDDLASQRITIVDIAKALKEETPYLLFYQIMPIDGDPGSIMEGEQRASIEQSEAHDSGIAGLSATTSNDAISPGRPSLEVPSAVEVRGRAPGDDSGQGSRSISELSPVSSQRDPSATGRATTTSHSGGQSPRPGEGVLPSLAQSRSSDSAPGKISLNMRIGGSKDALPLPEISAVPEVHVEEVAESLKSAKTSASRRNSLQVMPPAQSASAVRIQKVPPKREKSRSRLSKPGVSKQKGDKPERECVVM